MIEHAYSTFYHFLTQSVYLKNCFKNSLFYQVTGRPYLSSLNIYVILIGWPVTHTHTHTHVCVCVCITIYIRFYIAIVYISLIYTLFNPTISGFSVFIAFSKIPSFHKLQYAFMSMEGVVMHWFYIWNQNNSDSDWESFSTTLIKRFRDRYRITFLKD